LGHYSQEELSAVIGQIYDCAVDPELWPPTLTGIRDRMNLAYVHVNFSDESYQFLDARTQAGAFRSKWDQSWMDQLPPMLASVPTIGLWAALEIDDSTSQMEFIPELEFQRSDFYRQWVQPQGLRDYCFTSVAKRAGMAGSVGAATYASRGLVTEDERGTFRLLAPHFRRALLISGMLDEGKFQLQLYRRLLDRIGAGVLIVGNDSQLVYANETADRLLSQGDNLTVRHNRVCTASPPLEKGFQLALARACSQDDSALGNFGNGIPLPGKEGSSAVCYVLPLGKSERRRELGPGLAAVFITTHGASVPPALEVLSALSGMTSREARIALMIADGSAPNEAARTLGISINTVRTHIAKIFEKTGVSSQLGLAKFVGALSLPVVDAGQKTLSAR
jgi:DNA-binding CsgD family transcriptional regulator/PAS domain-containing protein